MKEKLAQFLEEEMGECPLCKTPLQNLETSFLAEKDGVYLTFIKCKKCSSSAMALVSMNSLGVDSLEMITNLSLNDILRFKGMINQSQRGVIETKKTWSEDGNISGNFT